ncbi:unnamed protein product [Staurois parvus]|uniref:Secreted protein n=1 Tax=Staurois parvus TaxID=386267 RepID=A0ABN9AFK2_9NEOB|nr:unnamed protein product [Staurois parvus]
MRCPRTFFIGFFFQFGQGHRGLMIPYCPGAPMSCQSAPANDPSTASLIPGWTTQNTHIRLVSMNIQ